MAQEAEDRLAQLIMDEELSDARLGDLDGVVEQPELHSEAEYLNDHDGTHASGYDDAGAARASVVGDPAHVGLGWGSQVPGSAGLGSYMEGNMVTSYQSTLDPRETERLEQSTSVAK